MWRLRAHVDTEAEIVAGTATRAPKDGPYAGMPDVGR
jgi:hypothetical protein